MPTRCWACSRHCSAELIFGDILQQYFERPYLEWHLWRELPIAPLRPRHLAYVKIYLTSLKRGECDALRIGLQRIDADDVRELFGSQRHEALQLIFEQGDARLGWV